MRVPLLALGRRLLDDDITAATADNTNNNTNRVLGDPFLRTFYTAYNVKTQSVGLARATGSRTGEECAADATLDSSATSTAVPADNDDDGAGLGVASAPEGASSGGVEEDEEEATSVVTVGVVAGLGTMALLALGVVALAVRQRWKRTGGGVYRSAMSQVGGGGGGGFEMSKGMSSMAARHGGEAVERDEDFLQASPCDSSFRSSSNVSAGGGRSKRVVRTGQGGDEVASGGAAGPPGVFGRLLGGAPARAGFAAFEDADDGNAGVQ